MSLLDILLRRREGGNAALKQRAVVVRNAYLRTRGDHTPSTHAKLSNRVRQSNLLLDFFVMAAWIRSNYEHWKFYIRHPQTRRKFQELRNSQTAFALWLADYYGVINLDPHRPFMDLSDFGNSYPHRTYKIIGKKISENRIDPRIAEVWFALGSPRIFKATNDHFDLDNFFKELLTNKSDEPSFKTGKDSSALKSDPFEPCNFIVRCLNTYLLPIEATARPFLLLNYSGMLDYMSQVIAMGNHSTDHMLDVVEDLCPELAHPLVIRYRALLFDKSYDELPPTHPVKTLLAIADPPEITPDLPIYDRQILGYIQRYPNSFTSYPLFKIPLLALKLISEKTKSEIRDAMSGSPPMVQESGDSIVENTQVISAAEKQLNNATSKGINDSVKRLASAQSQPDPKRVRRILSEKSELTEAETSSSPKSRVSVRRGSDSELPAVIEEPNENDLEPALHIDASLSESSNQSHDDNTVSVANFSTTSLHPTGNKPMVPPPVQPADHKRNRVVEPAVLPRARAMRPRTRNMRAFVEAESPDALNKPGLGQDVSTGTKDTSNGITSPSTNVSAPEFAEASTNTHDASHAKTMQGYSSVVLPISIQKMIKENPQAPLIAYNKLQQRFWQSGNSDQEAYNGAPAVIQSISSYLNDAPNISEARAFDKNRSNPQELSIGQADLDASEAGTGITTITNQVGKMHDDKTSAQDTAGGSDATPGVSPTQHPAAFITPDQSNSESAFSAEDSLNSPHEFLTESFEPHTSQAQSDPAQPNGLSDKPRETQDQPDQKPMNQIFEEASNFATRMMENLCGSLPTRTHNVVFTVEDSRWAHLKTTVSVTSSTN